MRLYSMYFLCKNSLECIEKIKILNRNVGNSNVFYITNWNEIIVVLNKLASIPCIKEAADEFYKSVPIFYRDKKQVDFDNTSYRQFLESKGKLLARMYTVIELYETSRKENDAELGFDIKLPEFKTIKEMSNCIKDIEFVINQCPYLKLQDSEIRFNTTDIGSFWITFFIVGTAGTALLLNLSKVAEAAVRIKSHVVTVKQQEEMLRSMQIKNDLANDFMENFRKMNKAITDKYVLELEQELGTLNDGEEFDKVGKSITKLAEWMDKGLQIYSAIDAPDEVKTLFPVQEEVTLITDELQKLIEMKKENS